MIQNTTNRYVSNAFDLIAVFISFPLARAAAVVAAADFCCCGCASPPHPAPLFGGREVPKKTKSPVASALAVGHVCVCVGVMEVAVRWARSECKRLASSLDEYPTDRHYASSLS
jgi:hypothetical protein